MDHNRIADLTRSMSVLPSRRHLLRGLAGSGLGWGMARFPGLTEAKRRRTRKQNNTKGLCKRNGAPCNEPGRKCKQQFCLRAPLTIVASWTEEADQDTV